ncbi:hypothetical protein P171DRAFT_150782 [Karstenula rhodostoma CBS 690.94]|uniref:Uncharacterized protein n=1 Tax=Karstenula rhodostoma CBS 690.94 TaxID=1392251 RepID=A0A9P4PY45_9PLEO|nr:hypothetical protein P171DRAFT_150782 [Karstenula rhodostoma CBS 690.94]
MAPKSKTTSGSTRPRHVRAANDAFGPTSPHWNMPFHSGNATAAEILAYFPHWLKSVDVIDRFVLNSGKAKVIAGMLNKYRTLPGNNTISMNSICVMLQCAMRASGVGKWTAGKHKRSDVHPDAATPHDPASLSVSSFRTPRVTHPKQGSKAAENVEAEPIQFRDLAQAVKQHPSGDDALDLTRCVLHAVNHPSESWLFPVDFRKLVNHLGGAQTASHSHPDEQAFKRHSAEPDSISSAARYQQLPVAPIFPTTPATPLVQQVRFDTPNTTGSTHNSDMRLATPKKRGYAEFNAPDRDTAASGGKRRSGRLATQDVKDLRESDSDTSTPYKNINTYEPAKKKRKSARASSGESEFTGNDTSDSESLPDAKDDTSDDFLAPEPKRPVRASAMKGRRLTQKAIYKETPKTPRAAKATRAYTPIVNATPMSGMPTMATMPNVPDHMIDPALLGHTHGDPVHVRYTQMDPVIFFQSRALEARAPVQVPAPVLDHNRLVVDDRNKWLYAEESCTTNEQMWESALSSQRFNNGPRTQAPFRELWRLGDPDPRDMSDWAENIRWAKDQWLYFNVVTWTEYDDHLAQITQWRRDHGWWSETAISQGVYHYGSY